MLAVFLFLFSPLSHAADPGWEALLHFRGGSSSVKAGSPFFLAPNGHEDAEAELAATRAYFREKPAEAACRYPARALYLGLEAAGEGVEACARWRKWREAVSARGAELVFAAAFLNSPSSMYGHTLLKFVRSGRTEGEDLLDYTLNYGAKTGTTVGLPYVWLGLTGGFDGNYATAPFYLKVKEYNFVENRDFWIYPLKLSEAELRLLVAHAWELREVDFPYFFLRRNCSFYLLELLEVLRPGSDLLAGFPFWTVPVDTIRVLGRQGWLGPPRYRPSRYRRLGELKAQLTSEELGLVEELADGNAPGLPAGRETLLLDAAYELWRYRNEGKKDEKGTEGALLSARMRHGASSFTPSFPAERPPELGHPSSRAGLAFGLNRRKNKFAELHYRGTLHDLLADPHGYEANSELSMGDLRVRVEDGSVFLERFDLLRLRSVAPRERWTPRTAWHFRAGAARAKEFECRAWGCLRGGIDTGFGTGVRLGPLLFFGTLDTEIEGGSVFDRGWRWGAGPAAGLFAGLWPGARLLLEGEWRWRVLGSELPERNARLGLSQQLARLWELRLQGELARGYREGALQVFHYF